MGLPGQGLGRLKNGRTECVQALDHGASGCTRCQMKDLSYLWIGCQCTSMYISFPKSMPCLHVFCTSPRACVEVHGCPMRPANSRYIHREYRYVDCGAMGPSESRDQIGSNQIISDLCYSLGHQGSLKFRTPPIQLPERQGERREDKKGLGIEKRKSEAGIGRHSCRSDGSYG